MSAQKSINTITGSITGGILAATKIAEGLNKDSVKEPKIATPKESGKDIKMAAKARKEAQQKISAIVANKEISAKARTRRIGKVLDEYNGGGK